MRAGDGQHDRAIKNQAAWPLSRLCMWLISLENVVDREIICLDANRYLVAHRLLIAKYCTVCIICPYLL